MKIQNFEHIFLIKIANQGLFRIGSMHTVLSSTRIQNMLTSLIIIDFNLAFCFIVVKLNLGLCLYYIMHFYVLHETYEYKSALICRLCSSIA